MRMVETLNPNHLGGEFKIAMPVVHNITSEWTSWHNVVNHMHLRRFKRATLSVIGF